MDPFGFNGIKKYKYYALVAVLVRMSEVGKSNEWETPSEAWKMLAGWLHPTEILYDPFRGQYNRSQIYLQDLGFQVISSSRCVDMTTNGTCECMNAPIPTGVTTIVTNPPFSEIEETVAWFNKLVDLAEIEKYCILLPVAVLKKKWFIDCVPKYKKLEPRHRWNFIQDGVTCDYCPFDSCWVIVSNLTLDKPKKGVESVNEREYKRIKTALERWDTDNVL